MTDKMALNPLDSGGGHIAHLVALMDSISLHEVQSSSSSSELAVPVAPQTPTHTFNLNLTRDQLVMGTAQAQSPELHEQSCRLAELGQALCQAHGGSWTDSRGCRPCIGHESMALSLKAAKYLLHSFSALSDCYLNCDNQYIATCHGLIHPCGIQTC